MENVRIPWNDWKVVKQLGKGSYGTVYQIERNIGGLTDRAALKVISIPPDEQLIKTYRSEGYDENSILKKCESYLQDTLNEYKLMRSLGSSANIVYCEDIAYLPKDDELGFDVFIRMELLTPFQEYISTSDFAEKDIIKLGEDLCKALALCETHGIVHRDVKPSNIFVNDNGDFKLGDFGVAKILDHATAATRIGTEKFMAPEVLKREKYGNSVDLYSLGLVLYWLLNGRRMPFLQAGRVPTSQEEQDALSKRLSGDALPKPQEGSHALVDIILKACEYEQDRRYASAKEMLQALTHLSDSMKTAPDIQPEPMLAPAIESDSNPKKHTDDESLTDSWEEAKTVGKDFLDDDKESEYEEAEEKTIAPEWEEEKKSKEQKKNKDHNNQKYEKKDENIISLDNEIENDSSKYEPVPVSETIPKATKTKRFLPLILFLVGGLIVLGAIVFAAIYSDSNNSSSSSSYSSAESSTTIGGRTFETVTFGGIEWIVLAEKENNTLLLTKDILEYERYNQEYESVTWETCTLRSYLNGEWYNNTFSDDEKDMILTTNVVNSDNADYDTSGGNDTKDKVFLLSIDEVEQYFSSDDERVALYNGEADWWWLRSPGVTDKYAASVYRYGYVYYDGDIVSSVDSGIRPALWVNLNS